MTPWSPGVPHSLDSLQIVFKVVERCNINCSYCYYFNMGDESALIRPAHVSLDTVARLGDWLAQGCAELGIPQVKIAFHGGEPMMMPPRAFGEICGVLQRKVSGVSFSIQTNGTIWSPAWHRMLRRHDVRVGVSIDGDQSAHDRFRLDKKQRSTFAATERTVLELVGSAAGDRSRLPGTISVLDHRVDYRQQYAYLRSLGVYSLHYLLPDRDADDAAFRAAGVAAEYGRAMLEIFESWLEEDDPGVEVRFVDRALRHFAVGGAASLPKPRRKDVQILIVRSDGTVSVDDTLMPAFEWFQDAPLFEIGTDSLRDVLSRPVFQTIEAVGAQAPTACRSCPWVSMCRGGDLENRFSTANGFDNPSIYCDAYKVFYAGLSRLLLANGYPLEQFIAKFGEDALV